jgi:hypothetical protein
MSKRIFASVGMAAFVFLLYWVGGGNFERGFVLCIVSAYSAFLGYLVYFYSGWANE